MNDFPLKPLGITLVGVIFMLAATCGCTSPAKEYIKADRLTYEAIAPEFLKYVKDDPNLDDLSKDVRATNLTAWLMRIKKAEESSKK